MVLRIKSKPRPDGGSDGDAVGLRKRDPRLCTLVSFLLVQDDTSLGILIVGFMR
jgi:hypothetical protein